MRLYCRIVVALRCRYVAAREAAIERAWRRESPPHATNGHYAAWRRARSL